MDVTDALSLGVRGDRHDNYLLVHASGDGDGCKGKGGRDFWGNTLSTCCSPKPRATHISVPGQHITCAVIWSNGEQLQWRTVAVSSYFCSSRVSQNKIFVIFLCYF